MNPTRLLRLHGTYQLPEIFQAEASECGLACLAMIASFHGLDTDLSALRQRYPLSLNGATLADLMIIAQQSQLLVRPLRADPEDLGALRLPCILHWKLNHYIVLKEVRRNHVVVHDPALGRQRLPLSEVNDHFTGVALEVWPGPNFVPRRERTRLSWGSLFGRVQGLSRALGGILLLALVLELFNLASPFYMQWILDHALPSRDTDLLLLLGIGFLLLVLLQNVISSLRAWLLMALGATFSLQWRANIYQHLTNLPIRWFEARHIGDIVSRFNATDVIQQTLTTGVFSALLDGLMVSATLVLMFVYSPLLSLLVLAATLLYLLLRLISYRPLRNATERQIVHSAKQSTHLLETLRGIKTIKLFERQPQRQSHWLHLFANELNADLATQKLGILYHQLNALLFGIENVVVIWVGASLVLDSVFTVGALMAFMAYKSQFTGRVASLVDALFDLRMLSLQGERLSDIVLSKPDTHVTQCAEVNDANGNNGSIRVESLAFRYGSNMPRVLDGVDFTVPSGQSLAIIGASGCGKSTLLKIMLGVLLPEVGSIHFNGGNCDASGLSYSRRHIGCVLQDDVLFAGSILDNIAFFDEQLDAQWAMECARRAAVHDEIMSMPMQYHTLVGDMGTVLSGGQKQRILLARALYKRPAILFLDEATSHLDGNNERLVNQAIAELSITRILVAHRMETVLSAERVIALEDGQVKFDLSRNAYLELLKSQEVAEVCA